MMIPAMGTITFSDSPRTVSYTHLDVYKRQVHDEDSHKEQSLIAGLEILQQTLCLAAEGGEIGRE